MDISVTQFRASCLRLIRRVETRGESVDIKRRGKVVARLSPPRVAGTRSRRPWERLRGTGLRCWQLPVSLCCASETSRRLGGAALRYSRMALVAPGLGEDLQEGTTGTRSSAHNLGRFFASPASAVGGKTSWLFPLYKQYLESFLNPCHQLSAVAELLQLPKIIMPYYEIPGHVLEDPGELARWAGKALAAAQGEPAKVAPKIRS